MGRKSAFLACDARRVASIHPGQLRPPVGMYSPISIASAILVGGLIRWVSDSIAERQGLNEAQRDRVENVGVPAASGTIARSNSSASPFRRCQGSVEKCRRSE
jgi:uncharacterized oligopeptide transporter (OPT) family protein